MKQFFLVFCLCLSYKAYTIDIKYLIITHHNFYDVIQPLAQWKNDKGLKTKVVSIHNGLNSSAIRDTIRKYQPEYVLLVGDRNYIPLGTYFPNWSLYQNGTWSDQYYADTTDNDNFRDDIYLGRLPCNTVMQCSIMVNKILFYEQGRFNNNDWLTKATGIARDQENALYDSCYLNAIRTIQTMLLTHGFSQVDTLFKSQGATYTSVRESVTQGRGIVVYRGSTYSSTDNWNNPFGIDIENINNDSMPTIIISPTCRTMYYPGSNELSSAAGFRWLRHGDVTMPKGAAAFWGTTTHYCANFPDQQTYWRNATAKRFFQAITEDSVYILGEAIRKAKNSALSCCSLYTVGQDSHAVACSVAYMEWNLLGDPELNLWTAIPKPLLVNHDTIINTEIQNFTVTVKDSLSQQNLAHALVCLTIDTLIYQYDYTDELGQVNIFLQPYFPGILSVTVTKPNYIPYKNNVIINFEHDVGCSKIESPIGTIDFGETVTPACSVYNYGLTTENYRVRMKIGSFYDDTARIVNHLPATYQHIEFSNWEAIQPGLHVVLCSTELFNDMKDVNDKRMSVIGCSITVHTISATSGPHGLIEPADEVIIEHGQDTTFLITPEQGYNISNLIVDGDTISPSSMYTFEYVIEDHTIHVLFVNITHTLHITTIGNGLVTKNPDLPEFNYGTEVELLAEPEKDWTFAEWTGDTFSCENPITITMNTNKNITAQFVMGGWQEKRSIPTTGGKNIKDGGALAFLDTSIHAFQGGNKQNFFAYYPVADTWIKQCSIPFAVKSNGGLIRKKVKAGGSLVSYENKIYAFKGGNTREFWCYSPENNIWIQKNSIPETTYGNIKKIKVKAGGALVALACSIYAFKGGNTNQFWMYIPEQDQWYSRHALTTPDNKKIRAGGALTEFNNTIYAFVGGSTNYFYAYVPDTWIRKPDVCFGTSRTIKRKVKNGAALTAADGKIYAFKGGTKDLGCYDIAENAWSSLETIPGPGKIKGGSALVTYNQSIYAFKGGNTQEFYKYTPFREISNIKYQISNIDVNFDKRINIANSKLLTISSNPVSKIITIDYSVPVTGKVTLKLFNMNGRLVESLVDEYLNSGNYTMTYNVKNFAKGSYFLKYKNHNTNSNLKIILH
jgi:hypothetical protein